MLFEWYRMKKQTSVKINGVPSLNDTRCVAEAKENVKVKFALEQTTKAQKGSRGIALLFP